MITFQQEIGWHQFFRGRISDEWAKAQTTYLQNKQDESNTSGTSWASSIITGTIKFAPLMWGARNTTLRGKTKAREC